jgi:spore germination cell wall hydrolase CwlJ-like protein
MALGVIITRKKSGGRLSAVGPWAYLGLALTSASCTPLTASNSLRIEAFSTPETIRTEAPAEPRIQRPAVASTPLFAPSERASASVAFRGLTALDNLRSHDCLAQAIYYEAASESEEGQRAVAQVVLNRVRHPSWPNSVCGVVYQGPMRPGGGCQFTFTCDGSLARPATGAAWAQARRLAAEALAGRNESNVGLATHYHTHAVSPAWAPRLALIGSIGAHRFYRLPGAFGGAQAFTAAYTGNEPLPRPSRILFPRRVSAGLSDFVGTAVESSIPQASASLPVEAIGEAPPPSTVREEYRHSGQWRDDAPAAITGRR